MNLKKVHHIALICSNYEISKRFYTEVLGLKIEREIYREHRKSWKLDLSLNGEYIMELFSFPSPPKRPTGPEATGLRHLAFEVENINEALIYFREKNVRCETPKLDEYTGKKFVFIFDPDDLPIELYES